MRISPSSLVAAVLFFGVSLWSQREESPQPNAQRAPKPQPIPFSHKLHVQFDPKCVYCHEMPEPGDEMTDPAAAKCMPCHSTIKTDSPAIQKLATYVKDHQPVPWVQIYSVPDYVFFSHKIHIKRGKVPCETCHGLVAEREVITKEKDISMKACVDCHTERQARVTCNTCHTPHP
jgi:hypothetical protein